MMCLPLAATVLIPTGGAFFWLNKRLMDLHKEVGELRGKMPSVPHVQIPMEDVLRLLASQQDSGQ